MAEVKQISAAQRAQNFAAATRQNLHMLPSRTLTNLGESIQFTYPKARLLSKTSIKFDVILDTAMNKNFNGETFRPFEIVRRISLSLNNGFEPFVISGRDLAILNMVRMTETKHMIPEATGSEGEYSFILELENALNQRDASSLILLQNESTQVTLTIDLASNAQLQKIIPNSAFMSCKITPMLQTWTIPNYTDAFPDLSVIKLVKSRTETIGSDGEHVFKLDVGTIYRKLIFFVTNPDGEGENIDGNIELIYNTADTPISIDAEMLRYKNKSDFGFDLPLGMYVFDMSGYAGFSGYGGSRDFIDTERLSEFWARFSNLSKDYKVTVIQENLSRLR